MRFVSLFIFLFVGPVVFSQKPQQALDTLYKKYPQEKALLSLSKNEYIAGETVFFKAYVLTGYEPSNISTNLYVELLDKKKQVIKKQLLPLLQGTGEGGFALPPFLAEDVYYIRCYTLYQLNFDEAFQYIRPITVYNPASSNRLVKKAVKWMAAAFAEGGTLLDGVQSAVAVRLYAKGSLPGNWQGALLEKGNETPIAAIEILNNETGIVRFTPSAEKDYVATIKDDAGNVETINLPKAAKAGIALQANVTEHKLEYQIHTKGIASNASGYKLVGTIHDEAAFVATIRKSSGVITGTIDVSTLPAGVLRLTLFDERENPLNETLCFIHQQIMTKEPLVKMDTLAFGPKGTNYWQMELDSISWYHYVVQISDARYPLVNTFLSDLYLNSDLTSPVYNAPWYFQNVDEKKRKALHAFLITEKWQRFNWSDILNNRFPLITFQPEKYLTYTGTVRKGKKLQPNRDINLVFQAKDSSVQFVQVKTEASGSFKMDNIVFVDTMKVYYQANNRKLLERDVKIDFELQNKFQPYGREVPSSSYELAVRNKTDSLPSHINWTIAQRNNEMVLAEKAKMMEEVVIRTKAKNETEELDRKLSSPLFPSDNAMIFDFINDDHFSAISYSNILEWLQGRVPGYRTEIQEGEVIPMLRGGVAEVFIDEMPVSADQLSGFPVNDVAMIKVIRGFSLASRQGNGVIAIYTKRGGMNSKFSAPSLPNNIIVGYSTQPSFFSPDYSGDFAKSGADQREILYWNTMPYPAGTSLVTPVKFYNNDSAKKFRLVISGFTNDGKVVFLDRVIQ